MKNTLYLYLRPFKSDGVIYVNNPEKSEFWRNFLITASNGTPSIITLEEFILQCVSDLGSLIAIGKTIDIIGAGKIVVNDDEWKDMFMSLSERSQCIISVPSLHPSTLWELEWLSNSGMYEKVIMILTDLHFKESEKDYFIGSLIPKLSDYGWAIPYEIKSGQMISFDSKGECSQERRGLKLKKKELVSLMKLIVK